MYEQITAENAKKIMDSGEEHIILDTREQGHRGGGRGSDEGRSSWPAHGAEDRQGDHAHRAAERGLFACGQGSDPAPFGLWNCQYVDRDLR